MNIPEKTIQRLTLYHCILVDYLEKGKSSISSGEMARLLHIDASQVRKDIKLVKHEGTCRVGYDVLGLKNQIEHCLAFKEPKHAFIIGAGNLGLALAKYSNFGNYGLQIVGLFDTDAIKIDLSVNDKKIYHMAQLPQKTEELGVEIAILTVPRQHAQSAADMLIQSGIKYIWNFTPTILDVPKEIQVRNENLMGNFLQFTYK